MLSKAFGQPASSLPNVHCRWTFLARQKCQKLTTGNKPRVPWYRRNVPLCKQADHFREHRRDVINGRNDLPVPAHFNQTNHTLEDMKVAVLKAGIINQEYCKKQEMRLIFKYRTVGPTMTLASCESLSYSRADALFHVARARVLQSDTWANFNESLNGI